MLTHMAEALTQSQIDELLSRMRSGDSQAQVEQEDKVKEYDFSSPKKFTKDQLKSLTSLYENYARFLSSYFTSVLRSACEVTISQIEEQRYYEFNNALPDNALIGMIGFAPQSSPADENTMMLELPTSFGFLLIDRLMGGSGELLINGEWKQVKAGDVHVNPRGNVHATRVGADEDLQFVSIFTPALPVGGDANFLE